MMHRERPENCQLLLRKSHDAMVPGGLAVVKRLLADARADRLTTELMALPTLTYAHDAQRHRGGERAEARA